MFYILSKVAFFVIAPSHVCLIVLGLGIVLLTFMRTERLGRWLLILSFTGFVVFGFTPFGNLLILPLEQRFKAPVVTAGDGYKGIILLGGFEDGGISAGRKTLALIDAGERLSETVRLARQLPATQIIFTGGAGEVFLKAQDAGNAVRQYLLDVGLKPSRIAIERESRNTWENALFTKRLIKPRAGDRFLLVTSAWHMPRAMGIFRKVGFNVTAFPVDYRTNGPGDMNRPFTAMINGLRRVDRATKEWIGLAAYWATDRSEALFPKP